MVEAKTATQANITNIHSQIRESAQRAVVAAFLSDICRNMLLCLREKMQLPFWIVRNVDAHGPAALAEAQRVATVWQEITSADLGTTDLEVSIDVTSLSPVSMEQEAQRWFTQVLPTITNPQMATVLSLSEPLLRKTLGYLGIKAEADIAEIRKVMQLVVMTAMQAGQTGQASVEGQPGSPAGLPAGGGGMMQ